MTRRSAVWMLPALLPLAKDALAFRRYQGGRISPHDTISVDLGGDAISIAYGRPSLKGREFGHEVAPLGRVWRLGADEATKLTVTAPTHIAGGPELAAGSYSLWAIPGSGKWTLIINKKADTWGTRYDQSQDLARFDLSVETTAAPVEEFTITLAKGPGSTAVATFAWGSSSVSANLKAE